MSKGFQKNTIRALSRISRNRRVRSDEDKIGLETKFSETKNIIIGRFSDSLPMHRVENRSSIHVRDAAVPRYPSISSPLVNRSEISDQKGPVIRDGVRPVPRLASRTITLCTAQPSRTGPDREESRFPTSVSPRASSRALPSSFPTLMRLISRTG